MSNSFFKGLVIIMIIMVTIPIMQFFEIIPKVDQSSTIGIISNVLLIVIPLSLLLYFTVFRKKKDDQLGGKN